MPDQLELASEEQPSNAASSTSQPQLGHNSSSSSNNSSSNITRQEQPRRWIRLTIATIKAVLFLELASMVAGPLISSRMRKKRSRGSVEDTDSDLDPADVLMDYLTGRAGLGAMQLLRNDQLQQAVDNLITEDFEELGVTDRGREIRKIVDDIIQARNSKADTPVVRQQRVGLGRVGPLRFNNTKAALTKEVSPPTAAEEGQQADAADAAAAAGKDSTS